MSRFVLKSTTGVAPHPLPRPGTQWAYSLTYVTFRLFFALSARLRVEGEENVPAQGGAMIVCNHTRGLDFCPLGIASPRQINYMAKAEAFHYNWFLRLLFENGGVFPVEREKGDKHALDVAVDIIHRGKLLGMFPEGHRSPDGTLQRGKTGAARIALQSGAPVVPAAVVGSEAAFRNFPRFWRRDYLVVRFGKPFLLEGDPNDRAAIAAGTRRIMFEIAALLPPEMRGEWSGDPAQPPPSAERRAAREAARQAGAAPAPAPESAPDSAAEPSEQPAA